MRSICWASWGRISSSAEIDLCAIDVRSGTKIFVWPKASTPAFAAWAAASSPAKNLLADAKRDLRLARRHRRAHAPTDITRSDQRRRCQPRRRATVDSSSPDTTNSWPSAPSLLRIVPHHPLQLLAPIIRTHCPPTTDTRQPDTYPSCPTPKTFKPSNASAKPTAASPMKSPSASSARTK